MSETRSRRSGGRSGIRRRRHEGQTDKPRGGGEAQKRVHEEFDLRENRLGTKPFKIGDFETAPQGRRRSNRRYMPV